MRQKPTRFKVLMVDHREGTSWFVQRLVNRRLVHKVYDLAGAKKIANTLRTIGNGMWSVTIKGVT